MGNCALGWIRMQTCINSMQRCIKSSGHVKIRDHLHRQGSWDRLDEEEGHEWYPLVHGYKPSEVPLLHPGKQARIVIRGSNHELVMESESQVNVLTRDFALTLYPKSSNRSTIRTRFSFAAKWTGVQPPVSVTR